MEQIYFGKRIADLRKEKGMTQEALANILGVTNQAVSKWESDQCCPDIMLMPELAKTFEVSIDELFGMEQKRQEPQSPSEPVIVINDLPWEDDDDLHVVCFRGHRLQDHKPLSFKARAIFGTKHYKYNSAEPNVELHFTGSVNDIHSEYSVRCENSQINGNVDAGDGIQCQSIGGDAKAGDSISCTGDIYGNATAGDSIECSGTINGNVVAGDSIRCSGSIYGNCKAGDSIKCATVVGETVSGDGAFTMRKNGKEVHIDFGDVDDD